MRVAVIGGGIAGIACAHELNKYDIEAHVLEKREVTDGEVSDTAKIISATDEAILELASDFGLDDTVESLPLEEMGAFQDGEITTFDQMEIFLTPRSDLSLLEKGMRRIFAPMVGLDRESVRKFHDNLGDVRFDPLDRGPKNEELHDQSIREWMDQYSEDLREMLIEPTLRAMTYDDHFEETSADRSAASLKKVVNMVREGAFVLPNGQYDFVEGLQAELPPERLVDGAEVTDVREDGDEVHVQYRRDGDSAEETFDYAVLAAPINISAEILDADFGTEFNRTRTVTVEGDIKEDVNLLIGGDDDYNLRSVIAVGDEHHAYVRDREDEIDVAEVYRDEPETLDSVVIPTTPRIRPGASIPDLQYSDNVLLAGDFAYYPSFNTAARTGKAAASMIADRF
ncbi:FAD-dependent oxidoreductase [Halanaeroarchaeum sulfurireducens]|uniref:FAD dependent oxidoreductase domain-containing protein n=1 Tax=Halanaeroarchaeum sulfurireducens TaxID=1604004 RepID=A0A0F7P8W0_9EURY|nr:FAD-dependent oxidoreductase [Halanaeroarchaeum sulfurireducens]AKH97611.1 hypothetical protein HLASF_1123 [Halanaeroarchaeum sulfurireducens]ALG82007.1 hypothetical protein HLASA_1112 [Halanaeroarchaeum sulfurireducens]